MFSTAHILHGAPQAVGRPPVGPRGPREALGALGRGVAAEAAGDCAAKDLWIGGGRPMRIRSRLTLIFSIQPHRMGGLRPSSTRLDTPRHTPLEIASTEEDDSGMKEMQGVVGVGQGVAMDSLKLHLGPPHPTPLCPAARSPLKRSLGERGFGDRVAGHQPQRV
jgi:hypothetical protein